MAAPTDELDLKMHHDPVTEMITRMCISANTDRLSTGGAPAFPEISKILFFFYRPFDLLWENDRDDASGRNATQILINEEGNGAEA